MRKLKIIAGALLAFVVAWALTSMPASSPAAPSVSRAQPAAAQADLPWMDTSLSPEERTDLLIDAMTLDQKIQQIANEPQYNEDLNDDGDTCSFTAVGRHIEGIPELAIPDFRQANGGTGIRGGDCLPEPKGTALPAQVASAATFNRDIGYRWGQLLDSELRAWAHHVLWARV